MAKRPASDKVTDEDLRKVMQHLSSLGAKKGGQARWKDMTPEERSAFMKEASKKGVEARRKKAAAKKKASSTATKKKSS